MLELQSLWKLEKITINIFVKPNQLVSKAEWLCSMCDKKLKDLKTGLIPSLGLSTLYDDDICIHLSKNHPPPKYMSAVNRKIQAEEDLSSNILEGLADFWQQLAEQGRILEEDARCALGCFKKYKKWYTIDRIFRNISPKIKYFSDLFVAFLEFLDFSDLWGIFQHLPTFLNYAI